MSPSPNAEPTAPSHEHLPSVPGAVEAIRSGRLVILVDGDKRESAAYLVMAAQACTAESMSVVLAEASGFACATLAHQGNLGASTSLDRLELGSAGPTLRGAPEASTTGASAAACAAAVRLLADPSSTSAHRLEPDAIVLVYAEAGGLLRRARPTEAAVDLCRLASLEPVAMLAQLTSRDCTETQAAQIARLEEHYRMPLVSIADLLDHRRRTTGLVRRTATTVIPTASFGDWTAHAYESDAWPEATLALVKGHLQGDPAPLVRIHSSCFTGDLLGSLRCDCGDQLHLALSHIHEAGQGAIVYLEQEGRGIGLVNKLRAYALQDAGADTVQANTALGFKPDLRDYGIAAQVLADLGLQRIRLLTNNPSKAAGLSSYGVEIVECLPIVAQVTEHNARYLETKRHKMGHRLP